MTADASFSVCLVLERIEIDFSSSETGNIYQCRIRRPAPLHSHWGGLYVSVDSRHAKIRVL